VSPRGACYARRTDNRGSAGCIFRRGLRGDRDDHGPGAESTGSVGVLGSAASLAHGHQLCGELPVHRHYLDKPPLPYAVCRSSNAEIDLDQLRPSFHGVAPTLRHRMDCADAARVLPGCVLRRGIRVHRRCVQRLRARSLNPSRRHAGVRGYAARGEARSLGVLASFTTAMLVAFVAPRLGFGIICGALILHLRPEAAPGGLLRSLLDSTRAIVKDRVHRLRNRSRSGFTNR